MAFLTRACHYYVGSFAGLSRAVWLLAAITFVNRAGTMVVPFLSLYLTRDQGFSLGQVGWVMSSFGAGSVLGSWLGGRLTDRLGYRTVMLGALVSSGVAFILLQFIHGYAAFCAAILVLTLLSDAFRPAMFVAIGAFAGPEHRTRAVTLVRLAINLGFSLGPALGGAIILWWGYAGLFWIDGLTCLAAAVLMWCALPSVQVRTTADTTTGAPPRSPYSDIPYLWFITITALVSVSFLQYFSTMPLYYRDVHGLDEPAIGLLLGFNGLLIFLLEMPLVRFCEDRRFGHMDILVASTVLIALSFVVLQLSGLAFVLWAGMALLTVGEMLNFPFSNRFAYDRADRGNPGAYMGLFTIAWAVAHIIGHTLGLQLVARMGYEDTWHVFTGLLVLCIALLLLLKRMLLRERAPASM